MRAAGVPGNVFEELLRNAHDRMVDEWYVQAENATNGYMVSRKARQPDFNPRDFWVVGDHIARANMSPELAEWFDQHGRITRTDLRDMIDAGTVNSPIRRQDYLQ